MRAARRTRTEAIDWQQVRDRLARIEAATRTGGHLAPAQVEAVLEERARALARIPLRPPKATEVIEVATFCLAAEHYAIETNSIREVARFVDITPVPGAPGFCAGLLNLRGEILAVFDLRRLFGLQVREVSDLSRVIVLGGERVEFGALTDALGEVRSLRIDEVHEPPSSLAGIGRELVRGVTSEALIVLDAAALLRDNRLFLDQAEENGL